MDPEALDARLDRHGPGHLLKDPGRLHRRLPWMCMVRHFLRPPAHVELAVYASLGRLSPAAARFFAVWARVRREADAGRLHTDYAVGTHDTAAGGESLFVKVFDLDDAHDHWVAANEIRFAEVSVALALAGLSYGALPFAHASTSDERAWVTSAQCGEALHSRKTVSPDAVLQSLFALWALRAYGHVHHFDCHFNNFVVEETPPTDIVWAWRFEAGLEPPTGRAGEPLEGFALPASCVRVTIIDGGLATHTAEGRTEIDRFYAHARRTCGWDALDLGADDAALGAAFYEAVTDDNKFVPMLHYGDVPDAGVDVLSFFVTLRMLATDAHARQCATVLLGGAVRAVRDDPALGLVAFLELVALAGEVLGRLEYVSRPRRATDHVVPLPEPGLSVDRKLGPLRAALAAP